MKYEEDSTAYDYWLKSMGDPKADKEKLQAASPINLADKIKMPVLLVHGEYDGVVDVAQSEDMAKALRKAGNSPEYLELERQGHSDWTLENEILYLETVERFLAKHIGR